jgi:two-component sensor histidine kinase/integral membrane sensor domain MASE1
MSTSPIHGSQPGLVAKSNAPQLTPVVLTVITGVGYYMGARLALLLQVQPENIAVFWPASGLAAGALIALGRSARWPVALAVMVATVVANVEHGAAPLVAMAFGLCNALECLLVAGIVWRLSGPSFELDSLRRVLTLVLATLAATAIASIPATATLVWLLGVPVSPIVLWRTWLEADATGIITVAPMLIALPGALRRRLTTVQLLEGLAGLLVLAATATHVFSLMPIESSWPSLVPLGLLFPLMLWLAARCPPIFSAAGSLCVALAIVFSVIAGRGALGLATMPLADRIFIAQVAMLTLSICTLALSALIAGLRNVEAQVRDKEQRLRIASSTARLGVFEWHIKEDRAVWENDRMYELFGHSKEDGALSFVDLLDHYLDPAEREEVIADSQRSMVKGEVASQIRIRRRDGVWRDIEIIGIVEKDDDGLPERVVGVMADVTDRRRSEERQALLIGELDHRVKNALERVATLIISTRRGAGDVDRFVEALTGRIHSMARAHQLLSRERWMGVDLHDLVNEHLEAYAAPGRILVDGPRIKLTADATQALSMVLHELATNAAKYGALSPAGGRIEVRWQIAQAPSDAAAAPALQLTWLERDGPPVSPPTRTGFGSKVIREPVVYELGGKVKLTFPPEGVRCVIEVPMERVASG